MPVTQIIAKPTLVTPPLNYILRLPLRHAMHQRHGLFFRFAAEKEE